MIDPKFEIEKLIQNLKMKGVNEGVISSITNNVNEEISISITDLVSNAVTDAVRAGEDVGAEDFMNEVVSTRIGTSFEISTLSGVTDFSEPPFPMLPKLLKNAKVAKDGSTYKVIPLDSKKTVKKATNSMEIMKQINANNLAAKKVKNRELRDPLAMATAFSGMAVSNRGHGKGKKVDIKESTGTVNFKVASSKQDQATKWVHPGFKRDMTRALYDINSELQNSIDQTVMDIVRSYEELY